MKNLKLVAVAVFFAVVTSVNAQDKMNKPSNLQVNEQHQEDVSYYHNMMCAVIAHPDKSQVIPFAPEAVIKSDGSKKNDCERKAGKRLISDIRREHPHLKLIAVQDSIASNYPNLNQLKEAHCIYL